MVLSGSAVKPIRLKRGWFRDNNVTVGQRKKQNSDNEHELETAGTLTLLYSPVVVLLTDCLIGLNHILHSFHGGDVQLSGYFYD